MMKNTNKESTLEKKLNELYPQNPISWNTEAVVIQEMKRCAFKEGVNWREQNPVNTISYSQEQVKRAIEMAREIAIELNEDQCYEHDEDYILQSLSPSLEPVEAKQEPTIYINDNTISASKPVVVKTDTEGYVAGANVSLSNKVEVKEKYCECTTKTDITIVNGKHICHTCNKPILN